MITTIPKKYIYEMIEYHGPKKKVNNKDITISDIMDNKNIDIDVKRRQLFLKHYSYAVPSNDIISKLAKYIGEDSVLEVGGGLGLWAYLLSLEGVDIVSTDSFEWNLNNIKFYNVIKMDYKKAINKYDTNILMMIWPPMDKMVGCDMSYKSVKLFRGNKIIYIGEPKGGSTATNNFFKELDKNWILVKSMKPIQWLYINTNIFIYERKN